MVSPVSRLARPPRRNMAVTTTAGIVRIEETIDTLTGTRDRQAE